MASRIEKTTRRVAGRVRSATETAASATRRASAVLDQVEKATRGIDSRRNVKKATRAAQKLARSAAVGVAAAGLKRAVAAVEKKLKKRKPSRGKKLLKAAGAVAVVAGAAMIARKAVKAKRAKAAAGPASAPAMEPEAEMERGPDY
jgi:hydroxyethylthiazole kinase-like sugar kinase family protein